MGTLVLTGVVVTAAIMVLVIALVIAETVMDKKSYEKLRFLNSIKHLLTEKEIKE